MSGDAFPDNFSGFGAYVMVSSYLREHNIPYHYTGGYKDDVDTTEYEPVDWP